MLDYNFCIYLLYIKISEFNSKNKQQNIDQTIYYMFLHLPFFFCDNTKTPLLSKIVSRQQLQLSRAQKLPAKTLFRTTGTNFGHNFHLANIFLDTKQSACTKTYNRCSRTTQQKWNMVVAFDSPVREFVWQWQKLFFWVREIGNFPPTPSGAQAHSEGARV